MVYRPRFVVAAFVVAVLAITGISAHYFQAFIPQPKANKLGGETAEFLKQGSRERIDWQILSEDAFSAARNPPKPILFVVGSPWSRLARQYDEDLFSATDIQNFLKRNFVCVRVDTFEHPDWLNGFLPVTRTKIGLLPGFQCWILDATGHMFAFIGHAAGQPPLDRIAFLQQLIKARSDFDRMERQAAYDPPDSLQQGDQAELAAAPTSFVPNLHQVGDALGQRIAPRFGGFPFQGYQQLYPEAWRFLLLTGRLDLFRASMDPVLLSPAVDLLDGGFFRLSEQVNWQSVEYDKVAVQNADMMLTLALAEKLTADPFYGYFARRTFDSLSGEFMGDGLVSGCRTGESDIVNRGNRSSFGPRQLREVLPDTSSRNWAQENLGLQTGLNPQMSPYLVDRRVLADQPKRMASILERLRGATPAPNFAGNDYMDVNGYVAARMIEVARLWGDADRAAKAASLFDRLDSYRSDDVVAHGLAGRAQTLAFLSDYLGYADAALQDFLANGRPASLTSGLAVLNRARFLFVSPNSGEFNMRSGTDTPLSPQNGNCPEIADNLCESCAARMVRLCHAYGRLLLAPALHSSDGAQGLDLIHLAGGGATAFADIASSPFPDYGGYYCAASGIVDDASAFAVGPRADLMASELYRRLPGRLVSPAIGSVRRDLQSRTPGIYVVRQSSVLGPLTLDQAVGALGPALDVQPRTGGRKRP